MSLHRFIAMSVAAATVLAMASTAATQSGPKLRTSAEIQGKVQKSAELQRQALRTLTDATLAERLVLTAYAELDEAHRALVINASGQKSPDPLLKVNSQQMQQALALLQQASDALKSSQLVTPVPQRGEQEGMPASPPTMSAPSLDMIRSNLERALRLTNTVLATAF
jgi:hypothetical protein